jgi:hypothetical protein
LFVCLFGFGVCCFFVLLYFGAGDKTQCLLHIGIYFTTYPVPRKYFNREVLMSIFAGERPVYLEHLNCKEYLL